MRIVFIIGFALSILLPTAPASAEKEKLAVMPLGAKRVSKETVEVLDEFLINEIHSASRGRQNVISAADINAMLGLEKMKEAVGCDDMVCVAEIGGALGARFLVAGSVSSLGGEVTISLRFIDIQSQVVINRSQVTVEANEKLYRDAVADSVQQLFRVSTAPSSGPKAEVAPEKTEDRPGKTDKDRVKLTDWRRYVAYNESTPDPLSLQDWADTQNEESTALLIAEITASILGAFGIYKAFSTEGDENQVFFVMSVGLLLSTAGMLVADVLDIGSVDIAPR